jgi:nucleotide-binding universal stress UspA family protein
MNRVKSVNRILVALDSTAINRGVLQVATNLATRLDAELRAMFVEDINLLRLAELPVAREVIYGAARGRKPTVAEMEQSLVAQTARLRKLVDSIARQYQIEIPFEVLRGDIASEVCSASKETDLLVVGKNTQQLRESRKIGNITRSVLSSVSCNLLLVQHGASIGRPVTVFYTGSKASKKALQLAIQLVQQDHGNLKVILPASPEQEGHKLVKEVTRATQSHGFEAGLVPLKENSIEAIEDTLASSSASLLLMESQSPFFDRAQLQGLLVSTNTPVIIIN